MKEKMTGAEKKIEMMNRRFETLESRTQRLEEAIFGDGNGDPGMKKQVDEVHDLLIGARFTWTFLRWLVPILLVGVAWFSPLRDMLIKLFYN